MKNLLLLFVITSVIFGCSKKKIEKQAKADDEIIQTYMTENNISAIKTDSGLYVLIEEAGTGASCNGNSDVTVAYTGYFTDGEIFDQSDVSGITFNLANVIKGWNEGIPYFKEGGHGKLLIPSALAYGPNGTSGIPPNLVLIFDVQLIDVL